MTKLITSLDQLEPGMKMLDDGGTFVGKRKDYWGQDQYEIVYPDIFKTRRYCCTETAKSLFLDKNVEVPE